MKLKRNKIFLIIGVVIITGYIVFRNIPLPKGYLEAIYDFVEAKQNVSGKIKLSTPMFSFDLIEKGNNNFLTLTFKNPRSNWIIKKEIKDHIATYQVIKCNKKEYYYNSTEGYTIMNYDIKNHYLYNTISYKYYFGNYCENKKFYFQIAIKESNNKKIKQLIFPEQSSYVKPLTYKLFSYGLDEIKITIDNREYLLEEALRQDEINIEKIISKLTIESQLWDGGTIIYRDGGTTKYAGNNLTIIKCNTIEGNKDIYIGSKEMDKEESFCK